MQALVTKNSIEGNKWLGPATINLTVPVVCKAASTEFTWREVVKISDEY